MPGTHLEHEVNAYFGDFLTAVLHKTAIFVPGVLAPLVVLAGFGNGSLGQSQPVLNGVCLVAVGHSFKECLALGGAHVHKTADSDLPSLGRAILRAFDFELPDLAGPLGIVLVSGVAQVLAIGVGNDRDEVYVLPCSALLNEVITLGLNGAHGVLPNLKTLYKLLGEVFERGGLGGFEAEELGADYDIGAEVVGLLKTVVKHVLEEECIGQQGTSRAEATAIVGDRIAGVTAQVAVNLVVGKRPVKGALCPVVKDDGINLTVNLLAVYLLVEISAVGCLDKRRAEGKAMCFRQRCIDVNRSDLREVAPTGLLGLVAVPAAEQQV